MSFEPETTTCTADNECQSERPPAPSYLRLVYLGKMLQDDNKVTSTLQFWQIISEINSSLPTARDYCPSFHTLRVIRSHRWNSTTQFFSPLAYILWWIFFFFVRFIQGIIHVVWPARPFRSSIISVLGKACSAYLMIANISWVCSFITSYLLEQGSSILYPAWYSAKLKYSESALIYLYITIHIALPFVEIWIWCCSVLWCGGWQHILTLWPFLWKTC